MVVDTSAAVAILTKEAGYELLLRRVQRSREVLIGAPTLLEAAMVLCDRLGHDARPMLSAFVEDVGAIIVPFASEHYSAAVEAFMRFGKGRHPARLNFGDCMAYAVARVANTPLLYVGGDFSKTDITSA